MPEKGLYAERKKHANKLDESLIKTAYLALKRTVYYDKSNTDTTLRKSLIKFEATNNLDNVFAEILTKIQEENKAYFENLYNKINLIRTPKKLVEFEGEKNFVTNNTSFTEYKIERYMIFIDCPIELHLITILWIYKIGVYLDRKLSSSIYANRLNYDLESEQLSYISLYKPYYTQYSKWRDDAVKVARFIAEEQEKDSAILTMDVKDYYYSIAIDKEELKDSLETQTCGDEHNFESLSKESKFIHLIFEKIHEKYSEKLIALKYPKENNITEMNIKSHFSLPIGLLSSYILANWHLRAFDEIVEKKIKPSFYGRYVDDIIFVFKEPLISTKEYGKTVCSSKLSKVGCFIEDHLHEVIHVIRSKEVFIHKKTKLIKIDFDKESFIIKHDPRKKDCGTIPELRVQKKKIFLYYFDHKESISVLDKLKRDIDIASSEFRFFNECYPITFDDKIFEVQHNGASGKITTLKDYKINSFGLSVFLSKKIYNNKYYEINDKADFQKITTFFQGRNILDYSNHWERLVTFLVLLDKKKAIAKFLENAICEIKKIKSSDYNSENGNLSIGDIADNLNQKLYWAVILPISLNPSMLSDNIKSKFEECINLKPDFDKDIKNTRITNMLRQNLITIPLINYSQKYFDDHSFSLITRKWNLENFNYNSKLKNILPKNDIVSESPTTNANVKNLINKKLVDLSARKINNYEVCLFKLLQDINHNCYSISYDNFLKKQLVIKKIVKPIDVAQNDSGKTPNLTTLKIPSDNLNKSKLRVAVANFEVNFENAKKRLKGKANVTISRFEKITKCIDVAEKEKVDILVFPEFAVPVEFLDLLAKYVAQKQIAVVFGMEYIVVNKTAYNYCITILPLKNERYKDAIIIPRLKNHYAPAEIKQITGLGLSIPEIKPKNQKYDIFKFRGAYFSLFYCFELADISHRSLLKSKVDFVICSEYNKDINYFSSIVESASRDLHCYFVQCNTRQYGDSRITAPAGTVKKDLLKVKGGESDVVLIGELDIKGIRDFQIKEYVLQMEDDRFKLTPPSFERDEVRKRIEECEE